MKTKRSAARRGNVRRYVETDDLIVVMDVPAIYAPEAPNEALLEAKTLKLLDEAQRRAEAGDRKWLRKHGRIFEASLT